MSKNEVVVDSADISEFSGAVDANLKAEILMPEQEVGALRKVHQFLSDFDRVPGSITAQWSQMLDTVAIVANSLIAKLPKVEENTQEVKE